MTTLEYYEELESEINNFIVQGCTKNEAISYAITRLLPKYLDNDIVSE